MNLAAIVAPPTKHRKSNLKNKTQLLIPWTTLSATARQRPKFGTARRNSDG